MRRGTELLLLMLLVAATSMWRSRHAESGLQQRIEQTLLATTLWQSPELHVACRSAPGKDDAVELRMRLPQQSATRGWWLANVQELIGFAIERPVRLTVRSLEGEAPVLPPRHIYPSRTYKYPPESLTWLKESWPPCEREERLLQNAGVDGVCIQKWNANDDQVVTFLVKPIAGGTPEQTARLLRSYDYLSGAPSRGRFVLAIPGRFLWQGGALTPQARADFQSL